LGVWPRHGLHLRNAGFTALDSCLNTLARTRTRVNEMAYDIQAICRRLGVGEHTVLRWIHHGELRAFNVARRRDGKPRWRITESALAEFEASRTLNQNVDSTTQPSPVTWEDAS